MSSNQSNSSLGDLRDSIDEIDSQLIRLLNERADLVHEVGEVKKKEGLPIYSPEREDALLKSLMLKNKGRLPEKSIQAIYREIMSAALALEDNLKIAYLGPEGTWTHQAAVKKFGNSVEYSDQVSFADVFDRVERREADYGVVPIENSTEGAVNHTLDLFAESNLKICAQIMLRIQNALMAKGPRESIQKLYSHPQVFGQCKGWIQTNFPNAELIEVSSTTRAASIASQEEYSGALGGELAAQIHGLPILEKNIQDRATNTTRFLVIGEKSCPKTGDDRTSLMFSVKDQPGSLFEAIKPFQEFNINMSKIESRPSKKKDWEYFFYVDLKGHREDDNVVKTLEKLEEHCSVLKVLGSYPNKEADDC